MIGTFYMMESPSLLLTLMTFFIFSMGLANSAQTATQKKTYAFKVFLDDDEIGFQRFVVSTKGTRTQIEVEAEFDVKYVFITFYSYRHTNSETWEGECLQKIQAKTNDNGESLFVKGTSKGSQFQLQTHKGKQTLEGCIKTFAYWNPDWFQSSRLLNSQTGELQPVEIKTLGEESLPVRGAPTATKHHRIISDKFTIDLWYTMKDEWVGLQSTTQEGKKLRYELQ
ncbi:MAG: DUF6134 family protein [Nitrospirota bacterium]